MDFTLLKFRYLILVLVFNTVLLSGQSILINEFASSNDGLLLDIDGDSPDWIELYNSTDTGINLEGYSISDDESNLNKWRFPSVDISAKGYLLIFASGKDKVESGELHTNFKISQEGESLFLCDNNIEILSLINATFVPTNQSFGNVIEGNTDRGTLNPPTPNGSNSNGNGIINFFESGFYNDTFSLDFDFPNSDQEVYYTINGGIPSVNSLHYTSPIHTKNNADLPPQISLIPTTPLEGPSRLSEYIWQTPQRVNRANVIRYASFENGEQKSKVFTKTYFVDNHTSSRYDFPVVSIVTDSLNLFDYETGVFIPGKRFDQNGFDWWPQGNYNYRGTDWEQEVHLTYFDEEGEIGFETDAGLRMRGYGSVSLPQKSFGIYFREEYGRKEIEYPIFDSLNVDSYKRLVFRNSGNDFLYTHFRDALLQNILHPLDLETQNLKPSIIFINGEYWGIYNIREKYDEFYFSEHFNIDKEEINILRHCGGVEEGTNLEYLELVEFVESNDLSIASNYNYVKEKVDILNFIDYHIAETYFANYDWPCNNYKIWKSNHPESKWRYLVYDLDFSFGFDDEASVYTNSIEHATSTENTWPHCECSNLIFRSLLTNVEFKEQFLNRFSFHLNNVFDSENINQKIDEFEELYENEMQEHIERWNYPESKEKWRLEIDKLRAFANDRPCLISDHLKAYFNLETFGYDCDPDAESVVENTIQLSPNPNHGDFVLRNNIGKDIEGNVSIYNFIGKKVYSERDIVIDKDENYNILASNLANGSYVLFFENGDMRQSIKFVKVQY